MIKKVLNKKTLSEFAIHLSLLSLSALLFSLSFPSFIHKWGIAPLAFIAFIPIFIVIHRVGYIRTLIYGLFYGHLCYLIFNYWLSTFDPVAYVIIPLLYGSYCIFLFLAIKLANQFFPKKSYIVHIFLWIAYEFLRTKGFLGYSYGVIAYSQYNFLSLIAIADVTGVAGVSFIIIYPSALIGNALKNGFRHFKENYKQWIKPSVIWLSLFLLFNLYGILSKVDYSDSPKWKTALIQHNINSWRSGVTVYEEALNKLISLSQRSLSENPDTIIWSETAFVPSINYYLKTRSDRQRVEMIKKLFRFMDETDSNLILGNNDLVKDGNKMVNYNAIMHYQGGELANKYYKMHLVPFSEHFPYDKIFPKLNEIILGLHVNYYGKGENYVLFEEKGFKLAPLICFEDTFSYISRNFVKKGGEVLLNLTNDSWSTESASNMQHMSIAVFRSIENRRTMIRSTTGGYTTVIDPNGKRIGELEPFTEDILISNTPVYTGRNTIFTKFGSWFDWISIIICLSSLLIGLFLKLNGKREKNS